MEVDIPYRLIAVILFTAALVGVVVHYLYTTPLYPRVEGFYGGVARGSGVPDCLRTLSEGAALLEKIEAKAGVDGHGVLGPLSDASADRGELTLLLSKMACLKKDLLSPSGVVDATRYQPFETAHDRMAVAEVCGMCLQKVISPRELNIVLSTWLDRGHALIRRICTEFAFSESEVKDLEKLWEKAWNDVNDITTSRCLSSATIPVATGRDVAPFEPEHLKDVRTYEYRYGGLSASGWNGAV